MPPLVILAVAVALVLGLILVLRLNAFVALISAALVVSLLSPGAIEEKVARVAEAFGNSAGKIGIPIAMAAIVGSCMLASGAADRIVRAMLSVFGEKRGSVALAASGFTLSIPVFFDTVFFLLVPLGRSLFKRTGRHYLKYLLAIGAGGAIAHTLVPPTPGPLLVADQLGVDVGLMMLVGIAVGIPTAGIGLLVAGWLDARVTLENPPEMHDKETVESIEVEELNAPGLLISYLPIVLPILLVASQTIFSRLQDAWPNSDLLQNMISESSLARITSISLLLGNPNFALLLAAAIALGIYVVCLRPAKSEVVELVEKALMSAGVIVLITAAGGAFGAMLKVAEIGPAIQQLVGEQSASGLALLWLAFAIASLIKISQGSSTVAMITASGMLAAMIEGQKLAYNPVYLAQAIGCGALFGVWMNDSGFWLFCKMGRLTEAEGLKSWTVILAVIAITAMSINVGFAVLMPMVEATY